MTQESLGFGTSFPERNTPAVKLRRHNVSLRDDSITKVVLEEQRALALYNHMESIKDLSEDVRQRLATYIAKASYSVDFQNTLFVENFVTIGLPLIMATVKEVNLVKDSTGLGDVLWNLSNIMELVAKVTLTVSKQTTALENDALNNPSIHNEEQLETMR